MTVACLGELAGMLGTRIEMRTIVPAADKTREWGIIRTKIFPTVCVVPELKGAPDVVFRQSQP
jgi:hypothetical protein